MPAVFGSPLFCFPENVENKFAKGGLKIYHSFYPVFYLYGSLRSNDIELSRLLHNLRRKEVSDNDLQLLESRRKENLSSNELFQFSSAVAVFSTNKEADKFNNYKLKALGTPILQLNSKVTPFHLHQYFDTEPINVAVGCELFLTANINTTIGLYSGAICKFVSPYYTKVYKDKNFPDCILLQFQNISNPVDVIPIFPSTETFYSHLTGKKIKLQYWPIRLKYGLTCFKAQGLTLSKMILKLDSNEPFANATYTSISRVRAIKDLCIISPPMSKERFSNYSFFRWNAELIEEARRAKIYDNIYTTFSE